MISRTFTLSKCQLCAPGRAAETLFTFSFSDWKDEYDRPVHDAAQDSQPFLLYSVQQLADVETPVIYKGGAQRRIKSEIRRNMDKFIDRPSVDLLNTRRITVTSNDNNY